MLERGLLRHELREVGLDVGRDVGVGAFVDGDPGRRVGDEDIADAFADARSVDRLGDLLREVDQLRAARRVDLESNSAHVALTRVQYRSGL